MDIPPPPPDIKTAISEKPVEAPVRIDGDIPPIKLATLELNTHTFTESDRDALPIVRVPPIMPPRAQRSGHCMVRFDVSAEGTPLNVEATYCSDNIFKRATIKSVQKWKYKPKIRDGLAMSRSGVESRVTFQLTDNNGKLIPE